MTVTPPWIDEILRKRPILTGERQWNRLHTERFPDLNHSSTVIYLVGYDSFGPIRIGAQYVPWNELLIGMQGDTWEIVDW